MAFNVARMSIPIACTLDAASARLQVAEWQLLVRDGVERCVQVSPTRTELVLYQFFDDLRGLTNMMRRETQCCAFFRFALEVARDKLILSIEVPAEAASVLASFVDEITAGIR
jgi:hypothetical protein